MGCPNGRHASKDDSALVIKNKDIKEQEKLFEAKVVLLGDQHVGKSNIALRYCKSTFSSQHITTIGGAYFQQKVILSNGASIKLHIWDTGGQDRFRAMANLYYRDAQAAILTYDVTNETSFSSLDYWIQELSEKANAKSNSILLVLAGNKCDLPQIDKKVLTTRAKGKIE